MPIQFAFAVLAEQLRMAGISDYVIDHYLNGNVIGRDLADDLLCEPDETIRSILKVIELEYGKGAVWFYFVNSSESGSGRESIPTFLLATGLLAKEECAPLAGVNVPNTTVYQCPACRIARGSGIETRTVRFMPFPMDKAPKLVSVE